MAFSLNQHMQPAATRLVPFAYQETLQAVA